MGAFAAGQVVVLPFPFSDLSRNKFRPALLLAHTAKGDWIACQITSNPYADTCAVTIAEADFRDGNLRRVSFARPGKLFTAHATLFSSAPATVHPEKLAQVRAATISLIRGDEPVQ